jgi:hypothetical protein
VRLPEGQADMLKDLIEVNGGRPEALTYYCCFDGKRLVLIQTSPRPAVFQGSSQAQQKTRNQKSLRIRLWHPCISLGRGLLDYR